MAKQRVADMLTTSLLLLALALTSFGVAATCSDAPNDPKKLRGSAVIIEGAFQPRQPFPLQDAGTFDAGTFDAGTFDAGFYDAGFGDAGQGGGMPTFDDLRPDMPCIPTAANPCQQ